MNSDEFWHESVEARAIEAVGDFMMSLRDLPQFACDESPFQGPYWAPVLFGCRDAFLTSVRLCADFFWKMPARDVTARTLLPSWRPTRGEFLEEWWLLASKHVVHMGRERFPTGPVSWPSVDMSYEGLYDVAMVCHGVLSDFAEAYRAARGSLADEIDSLRDGTRPSTREELRTLRGDTPCPFPPAFPAW